MGDQLAGAGNLSWSAQLWVFAQPIGAVTEQFVHVNRCQRVVGGDVVPNVIAVLQCLGCPENVHARPVTWARRAANWASTASLAIPAPAFMDRRAVWTF